ncbi:MMPL family transporter [Neomicrococcus lactis]
MTGKHELDHTKSVRGDSPQQHSTKKAYPRWLRIFIPLILVLVWFGVTGVGGPTFGKLEEVQSNDQSSFLPATAEATKALEAQEKFRTSEAIPAIIVFESESALTPADISSFMTELKDSGLVEGEPVGPIPSEDGKALQIVAPLTPDGETDEQVKEIRTMAAEAIEGNGQAFVTGPAGFTTDLKGAFAGIDGLLLGVALLAVLVILLVVYRSVLLPFAVLFTSVAALCAAIVVVYWMAKWGWIRLDGQSQGILSILVIGAATDYSLLYVARFKEAIAHGKQRFDAALSAWRRSFEPIVASAGTVTVGLLCLLFSDLNSNKALGPIAASGIIFSVFASLTLLPAILALLGRKAFWPFFPKPLADGEDAQGLWLNIARFVRKHSRPVWIVTALVLAVGCLGITQLKAEGVPQSELVLTATDSAAGQKAIARHFDAGAGSPAFAIVGAASSSSIADKIAEDDGVASVTLLAADGGPVRPGTDAHEVDGKNQLSITLKDVPDSLEAERTIVAIREAAHAIDPDALVGGTTATALDTQVTAQEDIVKIIPLVLGAILIILMLLLRSVVAPLVLILTTVLSYGAAMGVSAWVFNGLFNFPGADPAVPLFGFVFLVALGVDYNIFLMTRVREEALRFGTHDGITRGLAVTGGVITSAGVVLAATFAALGVIPIMFLVQLGFIVAFGVLLDTFVVRSFLVPALGHELGRILWWPSKLSRESKTRD